MLHGRLCQVFKSLMFTLPRICDLAGKARSYCLLHQREAFITSLLSLNIGRGRPTNEVSSDSQNKWDVKARILFHRNAVTIHFWYKIDAILSRENILCAFGRY